MVAILIPPSIFGEMKTVFDSPVVSDVPENVVSRNIVGIEASYEVSRVIKDDGSIASR